MKNIALAIAAGLLGTTGVGSAGMSIYQFSSSNEAASIEANTEKLAANCRFTGGANNETGCSTSLADSVLPIDGLPGLPALDGIPGLDAITGLVDITDLVGLAAPATSAVQGAIGLASLAGLAGIASGVTSPLDCDLAAGLPANPLPLAMPSAVSGILGGVTGSVTNDVANITGVNVTTNSGSVTAAGCELDASKLSVGKVLSDPVGTVTGTVGSVLSDPVGTVTGAVGGVLGDPLGTVTGTVGGVLNGNLLNGNLLNGNCPNGSASASTGILGSLTAGITTC